MIRLDTPWYVSQFKLKEFTGWLTAQGAEVRAPTNPWEVCRYFWNDQVHIIYKNKHDRLTWTDATLRHYNQFLGPEKITVTKPKHPPVRPLTGVTDGIYPTGRRRSEPNIQHNVPRSPEFTEVRDILQKWGRIPHEDDNLRQSADHSEEPEGEDESPPFDL